MNLKSYIQFYQKIQKDIDKLIIISLFHKFQQLRTDENFLQNEDYNFEEFYHNRDEYNKAKQNMEDCRANIFKYLNEEIEGEEELQIEYSRFILLKTTFFTNPNIYFQYDDHFTKPNFNEFSSTFNQIQKSIEQLEQMYKKEENNETLPTQQVEDYEKNYVQQKFIMIQGLFHLKQQNTENTNTKREIVIEFPKNSEFYFQENEFIQDLKYCLEIIANEVEIKKQRLKKEEIVQQFIGDFIKPESKYNILKKYYINKFHFFDKFTAVHFAINSKYLYNASEDEVVLYYMFYSLLSLVKYNYLFLNIEQKLLVLEEKMEEYENKKFEQGFLFIQKFKKLFKQNQALELQDEKLEIVDLFKKWTNKDYQVSNSYINKQQFQLYIDCAQSLIRLSVIPELARFFCIKEQIPYQSSNIELGFVQQIIRGKRLYLKNPINSDQNRNYWFELGNNIQDIINLERRKKHQREEEKRSERLIKRILEQENFEDMKFDQNNNEEDELQPFIEEDNFLCVKICQINYQICILKEQQKFNEEEVFKFEKLIDEFIQLLDSNQFMNIYRKRQLYHTLCSLFIEENYFMLVFITRIKISKYSIVSEFETSQYKNLILSFKQDFDIRRYITRQGNRSFSLTNTDESFESLRSSFLEARKMFKKNDISLEKKEKEFQEIISYFGFLKRPKYQVLLLSLNMYIQHIKLQMELTNNQKLFEYKVIHDIKASQFCVKKVEIDGKQGFYVLKHPNLNEICDMERMKEQQIREITILSKLPTNDYIIQYISHQVIENKYFELFLEYCEGVDLYEYFRNKKREEINELEVLQICREILKAVNFIHENNVVHGDIKWANILINKVGNNIKIKLIDFSDSSFMVEDTIGFTKGFQSNDINKDKYNDYFSLGILLMKILYDYKFSNHLSNDKTIKEIIKCQCNANHMEFPVKCRNPFHKKIIKEQYVKPTYQQQYSPILLKQILSLLNEQPFMRCPLEELAHLLDIHIQCFDKDKKYLDVQIQNYKKQYGQTQTSFELRQYLYRNPDENLSQQLKNYCNFNNIMNKMIPIEEKKVNQSQVDQCLKFFDQQTTINKTQNTQQSQGQYQQKIDEIDGKVFENNEEYKPQQKDIDNPQSLQEIEKDHIHNGQGQIEDSQTIRKGKQNQQIISTLDENNNHQNKEKNSNEKEKEKKDPIEREEQVENEEDQQEEQKEEKANEEGDQDQNEYYPKVINAFNELSLQIRELGINLEFLLDDGKSDSSDRILAQIKSSLGLTLVVQVLKKLNQEDYVISLISSIFNKQSQINGNKDYIKNIVRLLKQYEN